MIKNIFKVVSGFMIVFMLAACGQVDNGERGLYIKWGETQDEVLSEGVYVYNIISTKMVTIDTKEKIWQDTITSFSSDVQEVKITFNMAFYPKRDEIANIYREFGSDFIEKIVPPITQGVIKEVSGKFTATEMVTRRNEIVAQIYEKMVEDLSKRKINLTKFDIVELDFRDEFEKAVEAKVIAVQNAEKAKNDTIRIQEEAKQKLIQAEAEAKAMKIKSEALSKNKNLVEYEAVQKWDGQLPTYVGNSIPFIGVNPK